MKQTLREGDTLARLGGDEFVAVLADIGDIDDSVPILSRLLDAAAQSVHIDDLVLQVSASLGVTFYPQVENIDADQLLRQPIKPCIRLSWRARTVTTFRRRAGQQNPHLSRKSEGYPPRSGRARILAVLPAQGEYANRDGHRRRGTDPLEHPEKGLLPPEEFLPTIENHSLAVELGEWVIDSALTQMERWHAEGLDIPVSVNVCAASCNRGISSNVCVLYWRPIQVSGRATW